MKNLLISTLLSVVISASLFAQEAPVAHDFGEVDFGATVEQIKAAEKDSQIVSESPEEILFNNFKEESFKHQVAYAFEGGKFTAGTVNIVNDHKENLAKYIEDFNMIDSMFTAIYGEPSSKDISTDDQAVLGDPAKLVSEIMAGNVVMSTTWVSEKRSVSHVMTTNTAMEANGSDGLIIAPVSHLVLSTLPDEDDGEESEGPEADGQETEDAE